MIEVRGLSKRYGGKVVLRGVDLEVRPGEIVALLGPNGAGKTTLLRVLATLALPGSGSVRVAGLALPAQAAAARAQIGLLAHRSMLYGDLSAEQNLFFYCRLFAVKKAHQRVDEVLELLDLQAHRRDPLRVFSRGMQQRLAIGRTILHRPRVLLLDEPHTGLDQEAAEGLNALLRSVAGGGGTILMASHDLERAAQLAGRVDILARGRIAASLSSAEMAGGKLARVYADAVGAAKVGAHGN